MKIMITLFAFSTISAAQHHLYAQATTATSLSQPASEKNLYIDVHDFGPGKLKYADVAAAHAKDLAVEKKYEVSFSKIWVNEEKGLVYCLSSANDTQAILKTHAEADGLKPEYIYEVTGGLPSLANGPDDFFLDVHYLGAGKVSAKDVAGAHKKDLAFENKYGVNFINYWVDEKKGVVICLSQAKDSNSIIKTHKEAHGLIPALVLKVRQGE